MIILSLGFVKTLAAVFMLSTCLVLELEAIGNDFFDFCRSIPQGRYPHPNDDTKYILCFGQQTLFVRCPPDTTFRKDTKECEDVVDVPGDLLDNNHVEENNNQKETINVTGVTDALKLWIGGFKSEHKDIVINKDTAEIDIKIDAPPCQRIVCFAMNWRPIRHHLSGKHYPSDFGNSQCTHVIYGYANLQKNELNLRGHASKYLEIMKKRDSNPSLKVLLAVGGWKMGSRPFSAMVGTPTTRQHFINSSIKFLREHNFDGLNLYWHHRAFKGSPPKDKQRYALLLKELRAAFDKEGEDSTTSKSGRPPLILSVTVLPFPHVIRNGYDIPVMNKNMDFINVQAFDMHGPKHHRTSHHSPLSVIRLANTFVGKGGSKDKVVIGIPLHARTFKLKYLNQTTANAPGRYQSLKTYVQVCKLLQKDGVSEKIVGGTVQAPYLVNGRHWFGYENLDSAARKVKEIRFEGFGGVGVWDLNFDDITGEYCGSGKYPMLTTISNFCKY